MGRGTALAADLGAEDQEEADLEELVDQVAVAARYYLPVEEVVLER